MQSLFLIVDVPAAVTLFLIFEQLRLAGGVKKKT